MRKCFSLIFAGLTSVAIAAGPQEGPADAPADDPTTEEAAPETATTEEPSDDEILEVLEEATKEAALEEKKRLTNAAAERAAAKGEKLASLTTSEGRKYNKVTITRVDEVGVRIFHEAGTARIKFAELPKEFQQRFGYDPDKAREMQEREKDLERVRERAAIARLRAEKGLPPEKKLTRARPKTTRPKTTRPKVTRPTDAPDEPDSDDPDAPDESPENVADAPTEGDADSDEGPADLPTTIPGLKGHIAKLEAQIVKLKEVAEGYEDKAKKIEDRVYRAGGKQGGNPGGIVGDKREVKLNTSKLKEAKEWRDKAEAEYRKVALARGLISKCRRTIKKMERAGS